MVSLGLDVYGSLDLLAALVVICKTLKTNSYGTKSIVRGLRNSEIDGYSHT